MRLLSYNIHKGVGGRDRRYRFERIIRVIEEENPDLVCLQEVDRNVKRSRFDDQPQLLADALHSVARIYQLNVKAKEGGYGNLVLSRWSFRSEHQISLRQGIRKNRGAQLVVVDTPEGPLHLVHFHLGLAEKERVWQAKHLLEHRLFKESGELPTVILGDSNDWRNRLGKLQFGPNGFHHVTSPPSKFRSFPAYMPVASLDKVFTRGPIHVTHARIARNAMAKVASDHLPVVVDFHIAPSAPEGHAPPG